MDRLLLPARAGRRWSVLKVVKGTDDLPGSVRVL